jgi:hypothetical protein
MAKNDMAKLKAAGLDRSKKPFRHSERKPLPNAAGF